MASQQQIYETKILLNSEQAKKEINDLDKKVEDLRRKRQEALDAGDTKSWQKLNKEVEKHEAKLNGMRSRLEGINKTLDNMSTAGPKQLKNTIKDINALLNSGAIERGSEQWKSLTASLKEANTELTKIRHESAASRSAWQKFTKFLNDSWGGLAMILGSISGLTMTIRKSVQDYAVMEEEMANVRKYTGLASEGVAELNEELKEMDTRTAREKLNGLAGAAGRLGLSTKEAVLEFVDAADKIQVALGDDLGEGAVDQIGKLAMAFGEDEKMGLRGAMLATGSAVNELSQNSSAQAGYLVDFTARVAGFGKQLGLTQAQIMGFGAVMDENLLRDEMAATAFGNMLTKMQTDTEKFARIAGMGVKEFTRILNEDANQAILRLADSLRSQDPQTMMKMLDDMGLDGNRAVGVLSTLADKIDDVRERQRLATEAYKEGNSVIREFSVMNNTVQARLEKCKKEFHEMTVELGSQLLPVVSYTCTGFSMLVKFLSTATKFALEHKTAIIAGGLALAAYTVYVNAATIATKAHTLATNIATIATKAFNLVIKMNPIGLLIAALTAAVTLFIKYRDRISGAGEATSMLRQAGAKLADVLAKVAGWLIDLVKWAASLYDKLAILRWAVNLLVTAFTTGFTTITIAVKYVIDELGAVATVLDGIFTWDWDKIKDGFKQGFKAIADAAVAQFNNVKRTVRDVFTVPSPTDSNKPGNTPSGNVITKEVSLPEVVVKPQKKQSYVSDADIKKREAANKKAVEDAKKAEQEKLKVLKEADQKQKAIMDGRLADNMLRYQAGLQDYRQFVDEQQRIQEEGLKARMNVWEKGSAEYEKYRKQLVALELNGDQETMRMRQADIQRAHVLLMNQLERDFKTEGSAIYQNEAAYREARFQEEMAYLEDRKELTREGSLERMQVEWDIEDLLQKHKLEKEQYYQETLARIKSQYLQQSSEEQRTLELNALEKLHSEGLIAEKEYQQARAAIRAQYADGQTPTESAQKTGSDMLAHARSEAAKESSASDGVPITGTISMYVAQMNKLKELYAEDKENHDAYLAAKAQATSDFCKQLASEIQAAYQGVGQIMSAMSSYYSAQSDYEVAITKKKYEKQIQAAGNNQVKVKKLQERQAKEEAAIKTKYNKKQVKIQIAQAIAQTAMNALNAYGSAAAIPLIGYIIAPIAAAMAVAAGMIQIAAIKKQAQAQEAGYYEGGFTGGRQYRKEAGVVHEGEFVANHQAVQNPAILPFLQFLDQAQRNNTVGSLTAQDVSRSMGTGDTRLIAPIVNVNTDNTELHSTLEKTNDSIDRLNKRLEKPLPAVVSAEQASKELDDWKRLKDNV